MLQLPTDIFLELYSNTDKIESSDLCETCIHCAYCQAIPDAVGNSETREVVQCYCYSRNTARGGLYDVEAMAWIIDEQ